MRARFGILGVMLALAVLTACSGNEEVSEVTSAASVQGAEETETAPRQTETATEVETPDGTEATTGAVLAPTTAAEPVEGEEEDPAATATEDAPPAPVLSDVEITDVTAFATPAGAAFCLISPPSANMAASISCEVAQSSVPQGEDLIGACSPEGFGWFFNFFADTGHGGFFCNHIDGITRGGGNPHYWRDDPWINPESVIVLANTKVAVLDYGRVMRAGTLQCSVEPTGLTCQDGQSGHGFTVNSASYVSW